MHIVVELSCIFTEWCTFWSGMIHIPMSPARSTLQIVNMCFSLTGTLTNSNLPPPHLNSRPFTLLYISSSSLYMQHATVLYILSAELSLSLSFIIIIHTFPILMMNESVYCIIVASNYYDVLNILTVYIIN